MKYRTLALPTRRWKKPQKPRKMTDAVYKILPAKLKDRTGQEYWMLLSSADDAEVLHRLSHEVAQSGEGYSVNFRMQLEEASALVCGKVANKFCFSIKTSSKDGSTVGILIISSTEYTRSSQSPYSNVAVICDKEYRNKQLISNAVCIITDVTRALGYEGIMGRMVLHNIPSVRLTLGNCNGVQLLGILPYAVYMKFKGWSDALLTCWDFPAAGKAQL